ncbi:hypothetical protein PV327_006662 [Microctonus hyperodae]|uniref:Uncharacterized protein n=2 Tax=Microctonus hyperodae TaxID=165561 RepID=A0AA39F4V0_MICHY|nr:hypothetical protein PV327_006662 [Microctonus hyperodae]
MSLTYRYIGVIVSKIDTAYKVISLHKLNTPSHHLTAKYSNPERFNIMILRWNLWNYSVIFIFFILTRFVCAELPHKCDIEENNEFNDTEIGITISPIMTSNMIREIGIYWNNTNFRYGDNLILFKYHPCENQSQKLFTFTPQVSHGFKKTGKEADFIPTSQLTFEDQCLYYYATWVRDNVIKKITCLSTHPNWMSKRKKTLGHLKMRDIFIPGTHDSAAYAKFKDPKNDNIVEKYTITQDEDILGQLIYGARYLDIRVGRYPNDEHMYWGNHGFIKIIPLQVIINDVKNFLKNTNEIVIFDVQEFPQGFQTLHHHHHLIDYLEREFADYLLQRPVHVWKTTLDEIWSTGKRLIIGYDNSSIVLTRTSVWPYVEQQWGDVRTIGNLYKHLNKIEMHAATEDHSYSANQFSKPRAAMAELTPTFFDVISNWLGGLRKMADRVDINITEWYNSKWHNTANIVAVDFIKATGIVNTAIKWNDERAARH